MGFHVRATRDFAWLYGKLGPWFHLSPQARAIEAVEEVSGKTVGMVAYDQFTDNSCTGHVAVEYPHVWFRLRRPAFSYPFLELGKGVFLCGVAGSNERSLRCVRALGFREVYRIRDCVAVGEDAVIFEMRREECRWLGSP